MSAQLNAVRDPKPSPLQFSLRRLLLFFAGCAAIWGVLVSILPPWPRSYAATVVGLVAGAGLSAALCFASRERLPRVLAAALGAVIGAFFGIGCLSQMVLSLLFGYDHGFGEFELCMGITGGLGAVAGATVGVLVTQIRRL